jgi:hypothetical protein
LKVSAEKRKSDTGVCIRVLVWVSPSVEIIDVAFGVAIWDVEDEGGVLDGVDETGRALRNTQLLYEC